MRILHFSDLHGRAFAAAGALVARHQPDWIVLSGDMLDEPPWLLAAGRRTHRQFRVWERSRERFLLEGSCTTYVRGNHEQAGFQDLDLQAARPAGLAQQVGILEGIPAEFGPWGFPRELSPEALAEELEAQGPRRLWISHVPPYGLLDRTHQGLRVGHRPLAQALALAEPPELVLCGHVHEGFGTLRAGGTLVVNAAGGYALLEWEPATGRTELLAQEILVPYGRWRGFLANLGGGGFR